MLKRKSRGGMRRERERERERERDRKRDIYICRDKGLGALAIFGGGDPDSMA